MKRPRLPKNEIVLFIFALLLSCCFNKLNAQNSMTGDGFGGRSWYVAHNYQVGAYSAFTVCGNNNQLYGWGHNGFGELGDGSTISTTTPVASLGMTDVKFYTTGYVFAAIKTDNTAWIWGKGFSAALPTGFTITPSQVLTNVKFVDAGCNHIVFVKNDGTVWSAGRNDSGELGNGTISSNPIPTPVQMTGITNAVRAVALGGTTTAAATLILLADGTVKITGGGGWFQGTNSTIPVTLPGLSNVVDIKGNYCGASALDSSGKVYSFGKEFISLSTLGLGVFTGNITPPTLITFPTGAAPIVALSSNNDGISTLALDSANKVYAWGYNIYGQLGDGTNTNLIIPKLVATDAVDIFAGENFSYILKADNTLWAAGQSAYGSPLSGSIWMNLSNIQRSVFTQIDPTISPMNLCPPKPYGIICPPGVNLGNDTTLCEGEKLILNSRINNGNYVWQDGSSNIDYTVNTGGTYWVNVTKSGCFSSDTIRVSYKTLPIIKLGRDTSLCQTDKLTLNAFILGATYMWQDNSMSSDYIVTQPGDYWVKVTLDGCSKSDTISVTSINCKCKLGIPNAITPNGDGINDRWIIDKSNCFQQVDVLVYNRYGSLVYQKVNYQNDWQGTYKLKTLPDATYYYVIKTLRFDKREETQKGNLTILR